MRPRYNPALLTDDQLQDSFVVRQGELEELTALVRGGVQHALVLGWRGMGKTTLLHRLALRVRHEEPELAEVWLPVLFDEEQYNIGDLADFWLNALRMVSVASGQARWRRKADDLLDELDGDRLEEAARRTLHDASAELDKRLLLLVDNLDEVIDRIGGEVQQARLREVLQHESWVLLIGASSRAIEATYDYDQPLYQQLRIIELRPLGDEDMLRVLRHLAERDGREELLERLEHDAQRVLKLRQLFGGNPRSIALLYEVWKEGPTGASRTQLEALLDDHTSLYKDRVERLAPQLQRVIDALAQRWEASTAEEIAQDLRLGRAPVSAQLNRLCDRGLVEKVDVGERATGYRIRERFFNLWFLMRGSRRSRRRLRWLAEWVDLFYAPDDLSTVARSTSDALREGSGESVQGLLEWATVVAESAPGPDAAELMEQALRSAREHGLGVEVPLQRLFELVADETVSVDRAKEVALLAADSLAEEESRRLLMVVGIRDALAEPSTDGSAELLSKVREWVDMRDLPAEAAGVLQGVLGGAYLRAGDRPAALASLKDGLPHLSPSTERAWLMLGGLALALDEAHRLRSAPAPAPSEDVTEILLTTALVRAGHPDAPGHAAKLSPSEFAPAPVVAALRAASGVPGTAAFAAEHGVALNWMKLFGLVYRTRPADEVFAFAIDSMDTDDSSETFAIWAWLAAIGAGRPTEGLAETLDGKVRAMLNAISTAIRSGEGSLVDLVSDDVRLVSSDADALSIDEATGPMTDQLFHTLLLRPGAPTDLDKARSTEWPALIALAQARSGDLDGARTTLAADPHPEFTPSMSAVAMTELATAITDDTALLEIAGRAHALRRIAPGPWQVHAAVCATEAALGRSEPALDALRWTLRHLPGRLVPVAGKRLVDLCLAVARIDAPGTLEAVQASPHADRLVPLVDALRIHVGDGTYRKRLPPERLDLADDVLGRLQG